MSQSVDLSGPRTKLARASELRGELANYIQQTLDPVENRPSVALGVDNATKEHILYVDRVPDLPGFLPWVGILVGDIVHNMRSSLDHLVFQLTLVNTAGKVVHPERTQFPICDTPQQYMRAAANNLSEVAQHDARIIQGFQPYCPMDENVSVGVYFHPLAMLLDY